MDDDQVAKLESRLASLERRIWLQEQFLTGVVAIAFAVGVTAVATRAMGWPGVVPLVLACIVLVIGAKRAQDEDAWVARRAPPVLWVVTYVVFFMFLIHWLVTPK
jgi:hypothetical protein